MSRSNQLAGLLTADPPSTLDTINEINTALGNDASLSTTLTNSIATKASKSGDTFTGNVIVNKAGTATEPTMRVTSALESSSGLNSHGFSATFLNTLSNANAHGVAIGSKHADSNSLIVGQHDTAFDHFAVKGDGKVGIGVTDPDVELEIKKSSANATLAINAGSANDAQLQFRTGDANDYTIYVDGSQTNDPLHFWDHASGTAPLTLVNGNVGIGTSSPSGYGLSLERSGVSSSEIDISLTSGTSNKECIINFGSNLANTDRYKGRIFYQTDNNVMGFWTNKTEKMRIESGGTVQITDPNSGSQQSTQDFKIGRATIQVGNVDTTSNTSYGAGFTFKTYDYNGSSFVNHDALRITAKGDVVVGHDNYKHGTAHDPNEGSHGTALLKTNGDFVQTGGDYDPRNSGVTQTLFTPYHRRTMISNAGRNTGQTNDMWYMWYKIDGVDGIYANGSTPYIELRVIGHSGHHAGSITRVIMINSASNDTGHGYLAATQMGKNESSRGYGQNLDVYIYGNSDGSNDVYMRVDQGQREGHVTIIADLYSCTRNMHSINNFGITYYGGGTGSSTTQPGAASGQQASFTN